MAVYMHKSSASYLMTWALFCMYVCLRLRVYVSRLINLSTWRPKLTQNEVCSSNEWGTAPKRSKSLISHKMINLALLSCENISFFSSFTFKSIILSVGISLWYARAVDDILGTQFLTIISMSFNLDCWRLWSRKINKKENWVVTDCGG